MGRRFEMKFLVMVILVLGMFACTEKKDNGTVTTIANPQPPAMTATPTQDATPVVTPAAPAMLEEGMSMDATPVM
jgi:hypothetical protein